MGNDNAMAARVASTSESKEYGVSSRQVEVHQAYYRVLRAKTARERKLEEEKLATILSRRHAADLMFGAIASTVAHGNETQAQELLEGEVSYLDTGCHQAMLQSVVQHCGAF